MRARLVYTIMAFAGGLSVAAPADKVSQYNAEGNAYFGEGKFDEALERYRAAQKDAPDSKELFFNIGSALAKKEKYDDAVGELLKIGGYPKPDLYSRARYDVGVVRFREAEKLIAEKKYQEALEKLGQAMQANQEAMRANREDEDPKYNYQLAKRRFKEVLQMIKEQEQQQQEEKNQQNQGQGQQQQNEQNKKDENKQQQDQQQDQQKQGEDQKDKQKQEQAKQEEQQGKGEQQQKQEEQKDKGKQDQNQQQSGAGQQQAQQQQEPQEGMAAEDARQLLNTVPEENKDALERVMRFRMRGFDMKNDW